VGEIALTCYQGGQDTRLQVLTTPLSLEQLTEIAPIDLAIISGITDVLPKSQAMEWLGVLRNRHAPHIIVISDIDKTAQQGWLLADFLALSMKHVGTSHLHQVFSYALENYQPKKDWLNSRFWANPENYGKYRW